VFKTSLPGNNIGKCQDCHMRDVEGVGCNKAGSPFRPTGSTEHPKSGQPLHDLTGGNAFVSYVLASAIAGSANYDAVNASLLFQGPGVLTLDMTQGEGVNPVALLAGMDRAKQQLQLAASVQDLQYDPVGKVLTFRVQNNTGHKLISGFPEGRRMFINIKGYNQGNLVCQINPYDTAIGTLKGLNSSYSPNSPALGQGETYVDELVYEMHPTSTITGETETFHFALATGRYKDNRIPPKGFRIADAPARLCEPVWHGVSSPGYYTSAEYTGGYDQVSIALPIGIDAVSVGLYYQTTSREYMEFLRDEINGNARQTLPPSAYIAQTDPFFTKLKAWGNTVWQLWDHNKNVPGAAPFLMAQASMNIENPCNPPTPVLQYAQPGDGSMTISWSNVHSADPQVVGYKIYHDQAGKAQLVAQVGLQTTYTDSGLTVGQLYCYKVTSIYSGGCESGYSNIICAVPAPLVSIGQARSLPDNQPVFVNDAVVTAGQDLGWGRVFVQSLQRTAGIGLVTAESLLVGQRVRFTGTVARVNGEWQVSDVRVLDATSGDEASPLATILKSIGNDPSATLNYIGLNTTGLLMRGWGTVTASIAPGRMAYIDDGSGIYDAIGLHQGLRVQFPASVTMPAQGSYLSVTGISRVEKQVLADWTFVNGQWYAPGTVVYIPSLWIRGPGDVQTLR